MKFHCRVVGHELVFKKTQTFVKIKLEGTDQAGVKVSLVVDEGDRIKYPFGSAAVIDFNVQQSLPLEK
jgi:hypothetical protein